MSDSPRWPTNSESDESWEDPWDEWVDLDVVEPASSAVEMLESAPRPSGKRRRQRLVLVGAGHAHLQILDWHREKPLRGVQLLLISPFPYAVYSGMVPSVLAGLIPEEDCRIDLGKLTARCGADLLIDKVVGLDLVTRTLSLNHYPEQNFDVVSFNVGSVNSQEELCRTHRSIVAVKPLATFLARLDLRLRELLAQWTEAPGPEPLQFAVVGCGAAGIELALCLDSKIRRERWPAQVSLIDSHEEILPGYSPRAIRRVKTVCHRRGITIHTGKSIFACDEDGPTRLICKSGEALQVDLAIWATGAAPPSQLQNFQLPLSDGGFLSVRPTLQTTASLPAFAVGDIADIEGRPHPKAGVYSVRQGPVLWDNLRHWLRREKLIEYEPQPRFLSLLSCGDGTAILDYQGWCLHNRWMWKLKQSIDNRYVQRFR